MSSAAPGAIVFRGPTDKARIALTFDDGPSQCTNEVLDVLSRASVKATFFMLGSEVESHADIGLRVRDSGHEIGLHGMTHFDHDTNAQAALEDVRAGADTIESRLGIRPNLFRAPHGHFVPSTLSECDRREWTPVHWSAWGLDWREGDEAQTIANRVIADLTAGAIVLLHDGRREKHIDCGRMLEALGLILAEARQRRLEPVTVSELLLLA